MFMMKLNEFLDKLKLAESCKTLYIKGCFGAPMNDKNKKRYSGPTALVYNQKRAAMINAASADTFGFDCVCLIKGILWGWNADVNKQYGGAVYKSNGVPDVGADGIVKYLIGVSTDFKGIIPGEVVWMSGHVGVYVGDGKVIECTPKWTNDVQYSNLGNLGYTTGHFRNWTKHGRLPWVEYVSTPVAEKPVESPNTKPQTYYTVVKGDTLSKIGKKFGIPWKTIADLNGIKAPYTIKVGQKIRIS